MALATHFICIGFACVNEICFWSKMCRFIGVFEDSGAGECEREWFDPPSLGSYGGQAE
jgi:hypothetical protein